MENSSFQSPANPHFFQPLLPGFDSHLTIPLAFFSKHIDGKNEQTTAKLRSDVSDKTWEVKVDGRRFTGGWKDFAKAHDFRIGDIIVIKHQGDMVFNATLFGPSCCEIQYTKSHIKDEEHDCDNNNDDNENQHNIRKVLRKKNLKLKTETESYISYDYCFIAKVTTSNLRLDRIYLPKNASSSKALNKRFHEMIIVNEEGRSWTLKLTASAGTYYIRVGWRSFCHENRKEVGDLIPFNLVGDGKSTPMICICPEEECSELMNMYKNREKVNKKTEKRRRSWIASSSSRFVTIILRAYNFKYSKLILPVEFTKSNGLTNHKKIILMDKNGVKRITKLVQDGPNFGRRGLGKGWKIFCEANDVLKIDEPFVLELIWEDTIPLLKFCFKVKNEPICV